MMLLREVTIHIQNRLSNLPFLRIGIRSLLCGFDCEENSDKGLRHKLKEEFVYLCVGEKKNNSFEIIAIIFKAYKKCKYPIQKGF